MKCRTFETCEYLQDGITYWKFGYCLDAGKHILDLEGNEVLEIKDWHRAAIDELGLMFEFDGLANGVVIKNVPTNYNSVLAEDFSQIELRLLATSLKDRKSIADDCAAFTHRLSELRFIPKDGEPIEVSGSMQVTISNEDLDGLHNFARTLYPGEYAALAQYTNAKESLLDVGVLHEAETFYADDIAERTAATEKDVTEDDTTRDA